MVPCFPNTRNDSAVSSLDGKTSKSLSVRTSQRSTRVAQDARMSSTCHRRLRAATESVKGRTDTCPREMRLEIREFVRHEGNQKFSADAALAHTSATELRSASRRMATICSSVNRLFCIGSSLTKSHLSRNLWSEETGQVSSAGDVPRSVERMS